MNFQTEDEIRAAAVAIIAATILRDEDYPFDDREGAADFIESCARRAADTVDAVAKAIVDAVHETTEYPRFYDEIELREKDREEEDYRNARTGR